ncbi:hypothetical protein ACROYT_G003756 [Oculina patagonica]
MMSQQAAKCVMECTLETSWMIKARFYSKYRKLKLMHVYCSTKDLSVESKDDLYEQQESTIQKCNRNGVLLITEDLNAPGLNAKVGKGTTKEREMVGHHGTGDMNGECSFLEDHTRSGEMNLTFQENNGGFSIHSIGNSSIIRHNRHLNAKVGKGTTKEREMVGHHSTRAKNGKYEMLCEFCEMNGLGHQGNDFIQKGHSSSNMDDERARSSGERFYPIREFIKQHGQHVKRHT